MAPYQKLLEEHLSEGTVSDAIYAVLRNCIIEGSLESGSRLRAEKIAGEMGVSRTPVREALQRLESDEFVIARPRKGLVVRGLSETDLVEIFQIREALEGMAARLAARNARRGDIAALETLVDEMELVKDGDADRMRELTGEFHLGVARCADNARLLRMIQELQDRVRQFGDSTLFLPDQPSEALREHRNLLAAIGDGDGDGAEEVVRTHRRRTLEIRLRMRHSRTP